MQNRFSYSLRDMKIWGEHEKWESHWRRLGKYYLSVMQGRIQLDWGAELGVSKGKIL